MGLNYVLSEITKKLLSVDSGENTVVVNGQYLSYKQKTVYSEITDNKQVAFFIRASSKDSGDLIIKHYVTHEIMSMIFSMVCSDTVGTYMHPEQVSCHRCSIEVDGSLNLLIIEGTLYHIAREAVLQNNPRAEVRLSDITLSSTQLQQLVTAFKAMSYENYYKFIFNKMQRRVLNRCYKKKAFFNILHAFIPVLISYKYIYNPLIDDPSDSIFKQSSIMYVAEKNNRKIEVNDELYCYMLTHEEICRAFGLKRFMRFTPQFFYRYLVGLLHPELPGFPTKTRTIYARTANSEHSDKYKSHYTELNFRRVLSDLAAEAEKAATKEDKERIEKEIELLNSYVNVDALFYEIEKNRKALLNIGAATLDSKVSTEDLYNIIVDGNIALGGV